MPIKNMPPNRQVKMDPITAAWHERYGWAWSKHPSGILTPPAPAGLEYTLFTGDTSFDAPVDSGGFRATVPTGSDRTIWISPNGSDANNGLTRETPIKTLTRYAQLDRAGYNDAILFDCLGNYNDRSLSFLRSGGAGQKVLGFYNAIAAGGRRPRFNRVGTVFNNFNDALLHNVAFHGLDFYAEYRDPSHASFNPLEDMEISFHGDLNGVEFHDNRFMFCEITIQGKGLALRARNIVINRNVFYASYVVGSSYTTTARPSCLFIDRCDSAYLAENFADYGGWHPDITDTGANSRNHCWYLGEAEPGVDGNNGNGNDFHTYSNIFLRGASHGLHQRMGGIQEYNFSAKCSVGLQIGYDNYPLPAGWIAIQQYNVATEGAMQERGINACQPGALCSHAVWGIVAASTTTSGAQFYMLHNIASGRAQGTDFRTDDEGLGAPQFGAISTSTGAVKEGNIAWHWDTLTQGDSAGYVDPGRTLASYHAFHGGSGDFDECAIHFRDRPLGAWNPLCTGRAIGDYIRAGFQTA